MKEISITNSIPEKFKKAIAALSNKDQKILVAALQTKICEQEAVTAITELINILSTAYTIAGQKIDASTLAIYAAELYEKLQESYPSTSLEEIRTAVKRGVYEEWGAYYGLNVKTFFFFIKSYLQSEERKEAVKKVEKQLRLLPEKTITPQEADKINMAYINSLYLKFLSQTLKFDYLPPFVFDVLVRKKIVPETIDKIRATKYISVTSQGYKSFNYSNISNDSLIEIVAKQIGVWDYFQCCKTQFKTIIFFRSILTVQNS